MIGVLLKAFLLSAFIGLGISYGPFYLSHIALAGVLVVILVHLYKRRGLLQLPRLTTNLHLFPALMLAWYLVTCLWSPNLTVSLKYLLYLTFGACISLGVVYYSRSEQRLLWLIRAFLILLGIEIVLSLLEAFTPFRYPISPQSTLAAYFGREMLLEPWTMAKKTLEVVTSYPTGFRWNPNNLATVLNLFLPFILMQRQRGVKAAGAGSILLIIVMTSSRINLAVCILIIALYLIFFSTHRGLYTVMLLLVVTTWLLAMPLLNDNYEGRMPQSLNEVLHTWDAVKRFFSEERFVGDSVTLRRNYLKNGLEAIAGSGGWGVGAGCAGEELYQSGAIAPGAERASLHNYWLEMAVDAGLLFAFLFWMWYATIVIWLLRLYGRSLKSTIRYLASTSGLALIGMVPAATGTSSVVYEPVLWLMYGIGIATINLGYADNLKAG